MNPEQSLAVVILAAGKGTRMKSEKAKVLHEVFFMPMVHHVLHAAHALSPKQIIVIVGHQRQEVCAALNASSVPVQTVVQEQQLGTGHAVLLTEPLLSSSLESVLILCGDTPLLKVESLSAMLAHHQKTGSACTLMTTELANPTGYGRVITEPDGGILGIIEEKDASSAQRKIPTINTGIYCVQRNLLFSLLARIDRNNAQGEFYLTDIIEKAVSAGVVVQKFSTPNAMDVLGVNSRVELAQAHQEMQHRRNLDLMLRGVSIHYPETTAIAYSAQIGQDCTVEAGVRITGNSTIGKQCRIGQGAILHNCIIGNDVEIGPYSCLSDTTIATQTKVPPLSRK